MALPGVWTGSLKNGYEVIIIGAGVQGLATAYELAQRGITDVLVVDRSWPGGGASGRNGELIRSAFASREWCDFFELSRQRWLNLSAELDYNVLFNRTGYAVLATTEDQWASCKADHAAQQARGIETELLDEASTRSLLPAANPELIRGSVFQQEAGFAHHDSVVAAYLLNAARQGVHIVSDVEVLDVTRKANAITGISLSDGRHIRASWVVNAAGGQALDINRMVGVDAGVIAARLEMIVTQPVKPFLKPGLAALDLLGYCHQSGRGEFVGGTEIERADETTSLNGTWHMLQDMATKFTKLFPLLNGVRLLRHWAGSISQTPDLAPVLGPVPELDGYLLSIGWVYGFMGAPAAGQLLAEHIATQGEADPRIAPFSIERIAKKAWIREGSLVVDAAY